MQSISRPCTPAESISRPGCFLRERPCCVGAHLAHALDVGFGFFAGIDAWAVMMGGNRAHAILLLRQAGAPHDPLGGRRWETPAATVFERLSAIEEMPSLQGADLGGANLEAAGLGGADLRGADLRYANLEHAHLVAANLRGADLKGVFMAYANLWDADLQGADLRNANLRGATFGGTNLRDIKLFRPFSAGCLRRSQQKKGAVIRGTARSPGRTRLRLTARRFISWLTGQHSTRNGSDANYFSTV